MCRCTWNRTGAANGLKPARPGTFGWQIPPDFGTHSVAAFRSRGAIKRAPTRLHPPQTKEMQMPHVIRTRNGGKSFELRIKHRLLQSPFYGTFATREEAERVAARGLAALEKGEIPP